MRSDRVTTIDRKPAHGNTKAHGAAALLIIIAGIAAYANSFDGQFVYDDHNNITLKSRLMDISWETVSGRRPVVDFTFAVNYYFAEHRVFGYHLANLAIHLISGLILFGVVRRTLAGSRFPVGTRTAGAMLAMIVAVLWIVHPIQTQSVTYITQRGESLMGMFYLLTVYCVIRGAALPASKLWYVASVATCSLGMGSKGIMISAPVVTLLYDRTFLAGSFMAAIRRRWALYAGLFAAISLLFVLDVASGVLSTHRAGATVGFSVKSVTPVDYLLTQPGVIAHYLRLSLWPSALCLDHAWPIAKSAIPVALPAMMVGALFVGTLWALVRKPALGFVGAWFFLILAPTSSIVPIKDPIYEHRMYLSLAAVLVGAVLGGHTLLAHLRRRGIGMPSGWHAAGPVLVTVAIVACSAATFARNQTYQSAVGMWEDVISKYPQHARAYHCMGDAFLRDEHLAQAADAYRVWVRLEPTSANSHYNLGTALFRSTKLREAADAFREATRVSPNFANAHFNLGLALKRLGRPAEAIASYRATLRLDPNKTSARVNLANLLLAIDQVDEAISAYRTALAKNPRHANAHYNLGTAYLRQGKNAEALVEFRSVLDCEARPEVTRAARRKILELSPGS